MIECYESEKDVVNALVRHVVAKLRSVIFNFYVGKLPDTSSNLDASKASDGGTEEKSSCETIEGGTSIVIGMGNGYVEAIFCERQSIQLRSGREHLEKIAKNKKSRIAEWRCLCLMSTSCFQILKRSAKNLFRRAVSQWQEVILISSDS